MNGVLVYGWMLNGLSCMNGPVTYNSVIVITYKV